MARNDIVLLDSLIERARPQYVSALDESEVFELFCFDQVLKDFELSFEELEFGWTDGTEDGGIDGFFVFLDGILVSDVTSIPSSQRNPQIRLALFSARRSESFEQSALNSLCTSVQELLDLRKSEGDLQYPFREEVLIQRRLFRSLLLKIADRHPKVTITYYYCCRGETTTLAGNLLSRSKQLQDITTDLFSGVDVSTQFLGAAELLQLARRQRNYSLRLKFVENYISREGRNYLILVSLKDYYDFVTDQDGRLRRYLFESNVRDYLGEVMINQDIGRTLNRDARASVEDFWWLNNGVTILATQATIVGKELSIENVQIVNGLQTTETIFEHFAHGGKKDDDRSILVKVLLSTDETIRARIIKATNYQNTVDLSSLRGLDKIQQDIEHYLADHGWFYDRRKNYYKNQGKPADRIISVPYLASAVRAIALGDPARSQRSRSRALRDDRVYNQIFNPKWDLRVYLSCLEITSAVEKVIHHRRSLGDSPPIALVHYVAYVYACSRLGSWKYKPEDVATIANLPPNAPEIVAIKDELVGVSQRYRGTGKSYQGIRLNQELIKTFVRNRSK